MANTNIPVTKTHSYNVSVAVDTKSINAAVIFQNICFWVEQNYANERNLINGKYWTYNTVKAFKTMFPEMTANQISYALQRLEDKGYIESAFLCEDTRDRTKWYTVCDFDKWIDVQKSISENSNMGKENSDMASEESGMFNNINNIDTDTDNKQSNNNKTNNKQTDKGKNINKVNVEVQTGRFEKHHRSHRKTAKQKYLNKKAEELGMLNTISDICDSRLDREIGDEIFSSLEHYFEKYTEKTGMIHPILKRDTLEDIIDKMAEYCDTEYEHFEKIVSSPGQFKKIIDEFFATDYGRRTGYETNWHLPHFMSYGVLDRITQRLWSAEEVF